MRPNLQESTDLVTFLKKSLMENLIFSGVSSNQKPWPVDQNHRHQRSKYKLKIHKSQLGV